MYEYEGFGQLGSQVREWLLEEVWKKAFQFCHPWSTECHVHRCQKQALFEINDQLLVMS